MSTSNDKLLPKSCFACVKSIESVYTGGCVAVSKDETRLFTTCNEDIEVLDLHTGVKLAELKGDTEIVTSFAVKPDGTHLVSASRSQMMNIWDLSTYKIARSFKAHDAPVIAMDIDQTSTLVATGSADSTVKVWDIDRGYCTHNFKGHGGLITSVKFHPGKASLRLVSASDDGAIRVWNLNTGKCESVLESHVSVVRSIDFTQDDDGQYMVTAGRDRVINVWSWKRRALERTIPAYETLEAAGLLSTDSEIGLDTRRQHVIYSCGERGTIRLWDMSTGEQIFEQTKELNAKHSFVSALYLPQAQDIVAITNDQNLLFYQTTKKLERVRQIVGYNEEVIDMAYVGEDQKYLAVATNTEQLRIYNTDDINCELAYGHKDIILCLGVHNSCRIIATGSKDNSALVWVVNMDAPVNQRVVCVATAVGHTKAVGAICLAQGTDCAFMLTGSEDRTVKMWDLKPLRSIFDHPERAASAVSSTGPVKLRSLYTFQAHDKDINSICVAPNDNIFATGSQDKTAKVWDVATGKQLGALQGHRRGVWNVSFSPVDRVIATTSADRTAKLWSLSDFSCLKTLEGHTNSVLRVEFMTRGTQLMTTGSDGLIKLWNINNAECVLTLDKHENKIWATAKQSSEEFIATGGADSVIHIWKDTTNEEIERLHKEDARLLEQQQALDNFLMSKDYRNAIMLTLSLDQPHRLLGIFKEALSAAEHRHSTASPDDNDSDNIEAKSAIIGSHAIDDVVGSLAPEQLGRLLGYVRNWNTNGKFAHIAQAVLYCILTRYTTQAILDLPSAKDLISAIQPYSERHFSRLDGLLTDSFIVDYTLHAMDSIHPTGMETLTIGGDDDDDCNGHAM
ncbi:U3 small nucleolar RNA-associated protein [Coemansia interrupta]|uniref:U3 small nucleolar RNA-associated protein n=1 Tax=Coemansia interrupta TaxID=1126814 RepID=A0A9W8LEN1_9FUNG|nr:U3 small nucleolar RNA-associated protein [Coemansia interrupta]